MMAKEGIVSGRFADEVALVTGGASGIGEAIVARLVDEGAQVLIGDLDEAGLGRAAERYGDAVATIPCDICDETAVEAMVAFATERFGRLDAAFNVAGAAKVGPLTEMDYDDWRFTLRTCLDGTFLTMRHEARAMLAQGDGGAIVNIGSQSSHTPMVDTAAYCAAKAGVAMISRCGALEWGEAGIRVNTVSPGFVDTPMSAPLKEIPAAMDLMLERIPAGRMARPEEIAAAALFLAGDDASYVSGVNLKVDAGWSTTGAPNLRAVLAEAFD